MSRIPVIIAAKNEAAYIGRTLEALPQAIVEPIVVVNDTTDTTAAIAEEHGATVLYSEPGKFLALQMAVKSLEERALEPILFTDADCFPVFPNLWARVMTKNLPTDTPGSTAGPFGYTDGKLQDRAYNTYSLNRTMFARWRHNETFMAGGNMAIRFHDYATVDAFLEMPHLWHGEDAAISKMVYDRGGPARQIIDPRAYVMVSARKAITLKERYKLGAEAVHTLNTERYAARAPIGSRPFDPTTKLGY